MPRPDAGDDRCRQCGYPVRGLPADGRCPECGLSAERSRAATVADATGAPAPLDVAPRPWMRRLARGVATIAAASIGLSAFAFAGVHFAVTGVPPLLVLVCYAAALLASLVALAVGGWWWTTGEPYAPGRRADRRARAVARWGALAAGPVAILLVVFEPHVDRRFVPALTAWTWQAIALGPTLAGLIVAANLARRAGRPALAATARLCVIGSILTALAEGRADLIFCSRDASTLPTPIPLAGDPWAVPILIATERFQPRIDWGTVALACGAITWVGTLITWAALWRCLTRAADAPVADGVPLTPAGAVRSTSPSSRP